MTRYKIARWLKWSQFKAIRCLSIRQGEIAVIRVLTSSTLQTFPWSCEDSQTITSYPTTQLGQVLKTLSPIEGRRPPYRRVQKVRKEAKHTEAKYPLQFSIFGEPLESRGHKYRLSWLYHYSYHCLTNYRWPILFLGLLRFKNVGVRVA